MKQQFSYRTQGTCTRRIDIEMQDGVILQVKFHDGCDGNTAGLSALLVGMRAEDAVRALKGIRCGSKRTSCPDQLAQALEQALREESARIEPSVRQGTISTAKIL